MMSLLTVKHLNHVGMFSSRTAIRNEVYLFLRLKCISGGFYIPSYYGSRVV